MKRVQVVAIDVLAVLVFAVAGRSSHAEANDFVGVLGTAWPFLVGVAVGHLLGRARRLNDAARVPAGIVVVVGTVVVGAGLRVLSGSGGAPVSFVVVTTIVLAVLMLGWRGCFAAIRRARRTRRSRHLVG